MGPLEKEIMGNILESVLSELDAFLALSAVSHAWRSAAGAPRLWQHWRFQDAGFDLTTWLADDKADIMTHQVLGAYPRGRSGGPIVVIPAHRISAMPPFVKAHASGAKEVSLFVTDRNHHELGSLTLRAMDSIICTSRTWSTPTCMLQPGDIQVLAHRKTWWECSCVEPRYCP